MRLAERILEALSRSPDTPEAADPAETLDTTNALDVLCGEYPGFASMIAGCDVVDFGCGTGHQAIALARLHGCSVLGLDTNPAQIKECQRKAREAGLSEQQCRFVTGISPDLQGRFGNVISLNSFEHFPEPAEALRQMSSLLSPGGRIFVTFGPPWFAPYGSHMHFFCRVPWLNLMFSERTVMSVRGRYRSDGAVRYEDVANGLNRMSIAKFRRIVGASGLQIESLALRGVKGLDFVGSVPVLSELLVNRVTAILRAPIRT